MKAILILDEMPERCKDCPFYDGMECYATGEQTFENDCGKSYIAVDDDEQRQSWCPLIDADSICKKIEKAWIDMMEGR